jgi:glycosyltransferase involved in cell wall biosynthesis
MQDRQWEQLAQRIPLISKAFAASARRRLASGLDSGCVAEAGILYDFLASFSQQLRLGSFSRPVVRHLMQRRDRAISDLGARLGGESEVAICNYSVALQLFRAVKLNRGRTILNYPIAHHRYAKRILEEEAILEPAFAESLKIQIPEGKLARCLDEECENADLIMVGSSFAASTFEEQGISAERLVTIPYGAEVSDRFTPLLKERSQDRFRVLFVGQITQRKGITYLFRGYKEIKGPGTELLLAGRISGNPVALQPYQDLYQHLGNVPQHLLPDLYRGADVFVLPTLIEGMPLVVLEAMACGIPVIVTPNGPSDIVRDGVDGFVVPIRDAAAITERLSRLREDPALRQRMGLAARQRSLEFTWQRYATAAANVVQDLLQIRSH